MVTSFLVKCRIDIENTIDLPKRFFIKHESSGLIRYRINGESRSIPFATPADYAEFLRKRRVIDFYSSIDGNIKMFVKVLTTKKVEKGCPPVQSEMLEELKWKDVKFTVGQIITMVAEHEMSKNKVINMFIDQTFKTAA